MITAWYIGREIHRQRDTRSKEQIGPSSVLEE